MFYILAFIFGTTIGSFVNVIVSRLHVAPIVSSRSKCLSCGKELSFKDLIPLVSHIFLKGKCRYCKTPYGIESFVVEIIYGLLFVVLSNLIILKQFDFYHMFFWAFYYTLLFVVLGVMALYDKKHTYVPVYFLMLYSVLCLLMLLMRYVSDPTYLVLLGPIVISLPFLIIWIVSKGKAIGFGDIILFLGVGSFFGIAEGFSVVLISVWIGAIVGLIMKLTNIGIKRGTSEIPFVPFIIISFLIILFTGIDVFSIATWLSNAIM